MQPIYLLRVFSGLVLRLGLSSAFLLGSAGLAVAASLLLYTATGGISGHRTWQAPAGNSSTSLSISQGARPKVLLALTTDGGVGAPISFSLPAGFASHGLATNGVAPAPLPTPPDAPKAIVRRSWATIKSAFR